MEKSSRIYVAGHRGLVGSAIVRALRRQEYDNLILRSHAELDLTNRPAVQAFFDQHPAGVRISRGGQGGRYSCERYLSR